MGKRNGNSEPLEPDEVKRNLQAETLGKDLLLTLVDEIKVLEQPWAKTEQFKQNGIIDRLRSKVHSLVRETIGVVEAGERPRLSATVDQVVFKDGVKLVLKGLTGPAAHALADAQGTSVLVVVGSADAYLEGTYDVKGEPDQPGLHIEAEGEDAGEGAAAN